MTKCKHDWMFLDTIRIGVGSDEATYRFYCRYCLMIFDMDVTKEQIAKARKEMR